MTSSPDPKRYKTLGIVFLSIGVAYLGVGLGGQRVFLAIGPAMIALGVVFLARAGNAGATGRDEGGEP